MAELRFYYLDAVLLILQRHSQSSTMNTIRKTSAALSLLLSIGLQAQEEAVTLKTPTGEIKGVLMIPTSSSPLKIVLIHAGSGPTDHDGNQPTMQNNSLKLIAEELYKNNIASLRFDKRGVALSAASAPQEKNLRFETYIGDTRQWIDTLAHDRRFSGIIVLGHSEGALIGLVASENNTNVKAYISIAGSGRPADDILKEQLGTQPQSIRDMVFPMIQKLKQGDTIPDVPPMLYSLFRPSVQPYMISWFRYNPQEEIKKLSIPILIVQGSKDIQVSLSDADILASANTRARKIVIQNMNHVLKDCMVTDMDKQLATYTNPALPLHKDLAPQLLKFIKEQK